MDELVDGPGIDELEVTFLKRSIDALVESFADPILLLSEARDEAKAEGYPPNETVYPRAYGALRYHYRHLTENIVRLQERVARLLVVTCPVCGEPELGEADEIVGLDQGTDRKITMCAACGYVEPEEER